MGIRSLKEAFNEFAMDRRTEVDDNVVIKDRRYAMIRERMEEISDQIMEHGPEELRKLLMRLEECESEKLCLFEDYAYKQGFKDAVQLIVMAIM